MTSAVAKESLDGVTADLQFARHTPETPVALVKVVGEGLDERSGQYEFHKVFVENARPRADEFDLDGEGFAFRRYGTTVTDFYDDDQIKRVYYPEMETLIAEMTGAAKVVIFDHTQRIDDRAAQDARAIRPPATIVHNDFTIASAEQRVRDLLPPDEAEARLAKRFGSINVWRPIAEPVETAPLVISGFNDLDDKDLINSERHYPDGRVGRIYQIAYNPAQRWYYFPDMVIEETILLKCYDSLTDGTARWTGHGSFQDPTAGADAAPRESIEIRSMVFWD